jgi:hypothetical protein
METVYEILGIGTKYLDSIRELEESLKDERASIHSLRPNQTFVDFLTGKPIEIGYEILVPIPEGGHDSYFVSMESFKTLLL